MSDLELLSLVNDVAKLGPVPPPNIVRRSEAGPPEDLTSSLAYTLVRPASPIHLYEHSRNPYEMSVRTADSNKNFKGINTPEFNALTQNVPSMKNPFWLTDLAESKNGISLGLESWLQAYVLNNDLSLDEGSFYLSKIGQEDVIYPEPVQMALEHLIEAFRSTLPHPGYSKSQDTSSWYPRLISAAQSVQLYLPRSITTDQQLILFLTGMYWSRMYRPERPRLNPLLQDFNLIDLYLVPANFFERYPARKLLSYYSDNELYDRFGRVGNYYFPKNYLTKQQQLDGLVALSLYRFGYFKVETWTRPIRLTFNKFNQPFQDPIQTKFNLTELVSMLKRGTSDISPLAFVRLALMIEASWPWLTDREAWTPFLNEINGISEQLHQEYQQLTKNPYQLEVSRNVSEPTVPELPANFKSLEQPISLCLLCLMNRDQSEFGLCGHGVCSNCQALLGVVQCPFCPEHFTAEALSDRFVQILSGQVPVTERDRKRLMDRAQSIRTLKFNRDFKYDWANTDYRVFK